MNKAVEDVVARLSQVLLGKRHQIRLALACLFAGGHLLIEDMPGMGKTTLSHALAKTLGLSFSRIQFTSDLLPADVLGVNIFERATEKFVFHPGPVFAQLVLADEINRATPKTQSALLEAMEEGQVTVEGVTRPLPDPFFVLATQNPLHHSGTYPLPESQLDRFLMCIKLGYPDARAERELLTGRDRRDMMAELTPGLDGSQLQGILAEVPQVKASDPLLDYLQRIIAFTRESPDFEGGLSPRGGISLLRAAQGWAYIEGRNHVLPDDLQAVLPAVVEHRINPAGRHQGAPMSQRVLAGVDVL